MLENSSILSVTASRLLNFLTALAFVTSFILPAQSWAEPTPGYSIGGSSKAAGSLPAKPEGSLTAPPAPGTGPAKKDKGKVLDVSPLQTYQTQLKQLKQDCAGNPDKRKCDKMMKDLRQKMVDLREFCRENKKDEKCGAILSDDKNDLSRLEQFCLNNPNDPKCVRRQEYKKMKQKRKLLICQKNPEDNRCKSKIPKEKRNYYDYLTVHCADYPESFKCKSFFEKKLAKEPHTTPESNAF